MTVSLSRWCAHSCCVVAASVPLSRCCNSVGWTEHVGVMRGLVEGQVHLGDWKDRLMHDPTKLVDAYLDCAQGQGRWSGAADARRR